MLVLLKYGKAYCGTVGTPTGVVTPDGEEIHVGDSVRLLPLEGVHKGSIRTVIILGDTITVWGSDHRPLSELQVQCIVKSHTTLTTRSTLDNLYFEVKELKV